VPVRHADDRAAAGLEDARHFLHRALGFVEVLDRAHRVDRVEAVVAKGSARTSPTAPFSGRRRRVVERGARLDDRRLGDVDAVRARAVPAGPREDARVLGLVPQSRS
jgi:hypothetical protein